MGAALWLWAEVDGGVEVNARPRSIARASSLPPRDPGHSPRSDGSLAPKLWTVAQWRVGFDPFGVHHAPSGPDSR